MQIWRLVNHGNDGWFGRLLRHDWQFAIDTVAAAPADPLYAPAAIAFGTGRGALAVEGSRDRRHEPRRVHRRARKQIFIANFAIPPLGGGIPGVVTMDVGVPGRRLP
jgi:hypothetical protein